MTNPPSQFYARTSDPKTLPLPKASLARIHTLMIAVASLATYGATVAAMTWLPTPLAGLVLAVLVAGGSLLYGFIWNIAIHECHRLPTWLLQPTPDDSGNGQ